MKLFSLYLIHIFFYSFDNGDTLQNCIRKIIIYFIKWFGLTCCHNFNQIIQTRGRQTQQLRNHKVECRTRASYSLFVNSHMTLMQDQFTVNFGNVMKRQICFVLYALEELCFYSKYEWVLKYIFSNREILRCDICCKLWYKTQMVICGPWLFK